MYESIYVHMYVLYLYEYLSACIFVCMYAVPMYISLCIYLREQDYIHIVYVEKCIHASRMYARTGVCMLVLMHECMFARVHLCICSSSMYASMDVCKSNQCAARIFMQHKVVPQCISMQ